ncbi:MAG: hypothetical protein NZ903_03445 [Candidatus Micrarchaeota archaeon]|nr:hypothetical protein [Candidatus Micrarchaeota archaeon]
MSSLCTPLIDVWPFIGLASALTISIVAFLYMIGRIIQKSELEAVAKKELSQFFISFLIVLGVLGLTAIVCNTVPLITQDIFGRGDQFSISYEYLHNLIYGRGLPLIQRLWVSSFLLESLSTIEYSTKISGGSLKFKPGVIFVPFVKSISIFNSLFTILIGSLQAQLVILQLAEAFAITLVLPLGLILRSIPGLRKGGSFLIAFAFGFYVVFPLTYVMSYAIYKEIYPSFEPLVRSTVSPLETFKISSDIILIFKYFDEFSILIPQATFLPILGLTNTRYFIILFTKFISDIE